MAISGLQQGIKPAAIGARGQVQDPSGAVACNHLERAGNEIIHRQKENLHARQNHSYIRHQFRMFSTVGVQRRKDINRKQEAPE
jgi:hypothetical protein